LERRKELRREMTPPEHKLWQALRRKSSGFKFRRQHSIGPYIADFYSRDAQLVVEVDGVLAHSGEEAVAYDSNRDALMQSFGLRVLRVPAVEVERNLEGVFEAIKTTCNEIKTPEGAEWVEAADLCVGDIIFADPERIGVRGT
jgi:adenine-specific DNA-methyltransferase